MHRVTLPDGGWADIRDADEVTTKGRRGIMVIAATLAPVMPLIGAEQEAAQADGRDLDVPTLLGKGMTEDQVDAMLRLGEATVVAFLAGWSYQEPLPTIATVGDLPAARFDALQAATASGGANVAAQAVSLDMSVGDGPDPKEPSGV